MAELRKLTDEEVQERLSGLSEWRLQNGKLHRELRFADFVTAFGFMAQIAVVAEKLDHHPEWFNVYNRVTIDLATHDVDGISESDFTLAGHVDRVAAVLSAPDS